MLLDGLGVDGRGTLGEVLLLTFLAWFDRGEGTLCLLFSGRLEKYSGSSLMNCPEAVSLTIRMAVDGPGRTFQMRFGSFFLASFMVF